MTFTELQTEILDRLNLSSPGAQTRVGRAINRKYRLITSSIGLQLSRRSTLSVGTTAGVSTLVFPNTEKIISVQNRSIAPNKVLDEVLLDELREAGPYPEGPNPTMWAPASQTSDTITIEFNRIPQSDNLFTLYADVHLAIADLSGTNEPAFPESFHDIIIEGVLSDELRKMEKPQLAQIAASEYQRILSDLRMWIAKSGYLDIVQGKSTSSTSTSTSGGSGGSINGAASWTQTGLITFDRDPSAPFAVTASSAVVTNLDADKLDGFHETSFFKLADNETVTGNTTFSGTVTHSSTTTAPTETPGSNNTRVATTAFVAAGLALKANLAGPTFTGVPAAPTAAVGTNTTQLATTAFVQAANVPRVTTTASSTTPTPNADTTDLYSVTALAAGATFGAPTGTPVNGQKLIIRIKDNTTIRALAWNASYVAGGVNLPSTTISGKIMTIGFIYNTDNSLNKWQCVALAQEA